jgi:hypothetical protein
VDRAQLETDANLGKILDLGELKVA